MLIQGVRFTYGDEGDIAFLIATSQTRADALEEAAASAAPDIAERLRAEAQVHAQVAEAMRTSVVIGNDPRFVLPSGGYDLEASLANDRAEEGADLLADDPLATVKAGDEASRHAIDDPDDHDRRRLRLPRGSAGASAPVEATAPALWRAGWHLGRPLCSR